MKTEANMEPDQEMYEEDVRMKELKDAYKTIDKLRLEVSQLRGEKFRQSRLLTNQFTREINAVRRENQILLERVNELLQQVQQLQEERAQEWPC